MVRRLDSGNSAVVTCSLTEIKTQLITASVAQEYIRPFGLIYSWLLEGAVTPQCHYFHSLESTLMG